MFESLLQTLYEVLKRNIERDNDVLAQRKELAKELHDVGKKWTRLLRKMITDSVAQWEREGKTAALREVRKLMRDNLAADYRAMTEHSPIILDLEQDRRFQPFAAACKEFYESAINLKGLAYAQIAERGDATPIHPDLVQLATTWIDRLDLMYEKLNEEYHATKTIVPK